MCESQFRRVITEPDGAWVDVEDPDGRRMRVCLLAYEGVRPAVGTWLLVHSGYALGAVSTTEAKATIAEIARADVAHREGER